MKFTTGKVGILALIGVLFLSGCSKVDENLVTNENPTQNPPIIETTVENTEETTVDPAAGISLPVNDPGAKAIQFDRMIEGIKSITLKDLDGNIVDRAFSAEETAVIENAFNESFIMDTAYIEMITGYSMTINLDNGEEVFITSYGDPVFIVARIGEGETYHLGCETIASILLEGMK